MNTQEKQNAIWQHKDKTLKQLKQELKVSKKALQLLGGRSIELAESIDSLEVAVCERITRNPTTT